MAGKPWTARLLRSEEFDACDRLAAAHGCLFDSARWTALFGAGLHRYGIYDGSSLRGGFYLFEERRYGLRILRNPPFTPQVGPFFERRASNPAAKTNEERNATEAMAACLNESGAAIVSVPLSLGTTDCLPFQWRGFKVVPHYTYRCTLAQKESELLSAMSVDRRNDIRKGGNDAVTAGEVSDTHEMRGLVMETFARKNKAFPVAAMDAIMGAFPPGKSSFCIISRNKGRCEAGVYVIHDSRVAYYVMGGYVKGAHHGSGAMAIFCAMRKAKELGMQTFDFEGSIIPSIERYFRGFGGSLTPSMSVHKAWLPLEAGLKLVRREYF